MRVRTWWDHEFYVNGNPLNFDDPTGHCARAMDDSAPVNCAGKPIRQSPAQQQYEAEQVTVYQAQQAQASAGIEAMYGGLPGHPLAPGSSPEASLASVTAGAAGGRTYTFSATVLEKNDENAACNNVTNLDLPCDQAYWAAVCKVSPTPDCFIAAPQGAAEPTGFAVPPSGLGLAGTFTLPTLIPVELAGPAVSKLLGGLGGLLARGGSDELTQEGLQALVQQYARTNAARGTDWLYENFMSDAEQAAYDLNPAAGSRFLGSAVHRATAADLRAVYGDLIRYSPNRGPDFTYVPGGFQVELTTAMQVAVHQGRGVVGGYDYAQALYATYSW